MDDDTFRENTILKLNREFGKDELVAVLNKKVSEKSILVDQLESEVDHLNSVISSMKKYFEKEDARSARIQMKKEKLYKDQQSLLSSRTRDLKNYRKMHSALITENLKLKGELNK